MYGTVPLPILADLKGALVAHQYLQLVFFQKKYLQLVNIALYYTSSHFRVVVVYSSYLVNCEMVILLKFEM
jgi:hypothetical protein